MKRPKKGVEIRDHCEGNYKKNKDENIVHLNVRKEDTEGSKTWAVRGKIIDNMSKCGKMAIVSS